MCSRLRGPSAKILKYIFPVQSLKRPVWKNSPIFPCGFLRVSSTKIDFYIWASYGAICENRGSIFTDMNTYNLSATYWGALIEKSFFRVPPAAVGSQALFFLLFFNFWLVPSINFAKFTFLFLLENMAMRCNG